MEPGVNPLDAREMAARLVRQWAARCPPELAFDDVLPAMVGVAELVNTRLGPQAAARVWQSVAASACARHLAPAQQRWLTLFEATARRDAIGMAREGLEILRARQGMKSAPSEYAFFATVIALLKLDDTRLAMNLLERGAQLWVRPGTHYAEVRLVEGAINARARRSP
jgi:hypothetical protein